MKLTAANKRTLNKKLKDAFDGNLNWLDQLVLAAGYVRPEEKAQEEKYMPVGDVAKDIGSTDRVIRNYARDGKIPCKRTGGRGGGKYLVQPWITYKFLDGLSKRPKDLREPSTPKAIETEAEPEKKILTSEDPIELLMELIATIDLNKANATEKKLVAHITSEIRKIKEAQAKDARKVERADCIEMLLSLGKIFTTKCNVTRNTRSKEIFHLFKEKFDCKVVHAGALSIIAKQLSEHDQFISLSVRDEINKHKGKLQ